ncbi:LPXTG cell wall anchor domain-containing protein [Mediterraneibacter gnavus]|uniref:LPXTG cell wall anchor domain-containing protein n=1 Tax=Mediterraneibacter gnavus TaxID=33038 RepID=UPI00232D9797|nr:LPXTG cell wall anchor domain-containing protein [Mediterraneibacter gnavus]MDB8711863.1 LPXTG cell wall anchor domain-containing protein [Mediterraneibacter gnavus]MDB8714900.1 LPXTG cell wall anchor domain-containing protein [Mediterraneibacter gnavus]
MKKYIARIVVLLLIAAVLPLQVSAAEKESIELAVEAEQVGVSLALPQSVSGNILSLQVGLKVDSNVQEETTATFQFSENVAKVADYRYNQEKGILNIYLSGTKTLFQNGTESLKLGNVQINTTNENGATVHVSVVEDSVKMVKGTKTEVIQNIDYPEKAEIILGNGGNQDNGGDQNNGDAQDKTELQQVMEMAKSYKQSEYTKESYAVLQKAMEMAQKVLDKEDATEEEITEALKNLENAIGSMMKKEDTSSPSTDQDETTNQGADKNTSQNTDQKNDKNVVKTGDDSMVIPFVAAIAISVTVVAFIIYRRRRKK